MFSINKGLVYRIFRCLTKGNGSHAHTLGARIPRLLPDTIIVLDTVLAFLGSYPFFGADIGGTYTLDFTEQTFVRDHRRIRGLIVISLPHDDRAPYT